MSKYSCTMAEIDAGMNREAATLEYAELKRKWNWLRMRVTMCDRRPADTATQGDAYESWYAAYRATDKLDPFPRCHPSSVLWREMNRLARRVGWSEDGSDFVRSLHP